MTASRTAVWDGCVRIVEGVRDSRGREGFLLYAPASEALVWDLEQATASASREWRGPDFAWWIATSYLDTVLRLLEEHRLRAHLRSVPQPGGR